MPPEHAPYTGNSTPDASPMELHPDVMPIPGVGINTPNEEFDPTVTGDGLTLVFGRGRIGGDPVHLHYAARATAAMPFSYVGPLPGANDPNATYDTTPFLREDGLFLYFASDRVRANSTDIYVAAWNGSGVDAPRPVDELNTSYSELAPVVTPDGLTIYFGSDRPDGGARGQHDVWMATRSSTAAPFSEPVNVTELNSSALELPTFVFRGGCTLYLSR